jgi:hypothetical protein
MDRASEMAGVIGVDSMTGASKVSGMNRMCRMNRVRVTCVGGMSGMRRLMMAWPRLVGKAL